MHIILTRGDVSKYGLQGLVDANENEPMALDGLMGLLGMKPGMVAPGRMYGLYVEMLQLAARLEAAGENGYAGHVRGLAVEGPASDMMNDINARIRAAEGLTPAGCDPEAALAALIADTKALQARAVPILTKALAGDAAQLPKLPTVLEYLVGNWGPQMRQDLAADQQAGDETAGQAGAETDNSAVA